MAPQVGLEPTTLRLTAECSAIELLRNILCLGLFAWLVSASRFRVPPFRAFASPSGSISKGLRFRVSFSLYASRFPLIQIEGIIAYPLFGSRRRPILPDRFQSSTFGAKRLNFCVRYGYRWDPLAIVTGIFQDPFVSASLASAYALSLLRFLPRALKTAQ